MIGIIYESELNNPYKNLALEEYFLRFCEKSGRAILYMWQNANTIVIGRNQNAYTECNIEYVKSNNVYVARRLTGGGAVYHDLGNLNFTIILPKILFDAKRSTNLIVKALQQLGINAEANGRNDICIGDKKISGNAYYANKKVGMHHGTLLYKVDGEIISKALNVSQNKLSKHGVKSVKSRVINISSIFPNIGISDIKKSLKESFIKEYDIEEVENIEIENDEYLNILKKYESSNWNFDKIKDYKVSLSKCFNWGKVDLSLLYDGETLQEIEIATDALEADIIEELKNKINEKIKTGLDNILELRFSYKEYEFIVNDLFTMLSGINL